MTDQLRVSVGTASVLGLSKTRVDAVPTTAYFLLGDRCAMHCAFCAQARDSNAPLSALSRITWPVFPQRETISALAEAYCKGTVHRGCVQATVSQESFCETLHLLKRIRSASGIPIDASLLPSDMGQVQALFAAGLDHLGFGLDAASESIFRKVKSGSWDRMWQLMESTASQFPRRVAAHLIVGLGETERQALGTIQRLVSLGIIVGLFAFTPVPGTALADGRPPPLDAYRRIQAARWLLVHRLVSFEDLVFEPSGQLTGFGRPDWRELLGRGEAFRTCGCPDCNRPYYNERPGSTIYNYPWAPTHDEASIALDHCGVTYSD